MLILLVVMVAPVVVVVSLLEPLQILSLALILLQVDSDRMALKTVLLV